MTQLIYKTFMVFVLTGLVSTSYADYRKDFTKTIKEEFDISSDGKVDLSNQFGKLEINTWTKNSVKIAVTIIARTNTESQAQEIFDRIDIDFVNEKDFVKATTDIQSSRSSWWGGWSNNNADFAINYEVFVPNTVELDIQNRHGDTYITEMSNDAHLNIKHGSITADGFSGDLNFEMAHGSGTIVTAKSIRSNISQSNIRFKKVGNVQLESAHCNIAVEDAENIKLEARHSNLDLGNIGELRVDSRHSKFEIDQVQSIFSESAHSVYEVEKVDKNIDFDFTHGGATIELLQKGFEEVSLSGTHASFKIGVDPNAAFDLDVYGTHAGIRFPSDLDISYEKDKSHTREVKGAKKGSGKKGLIKARLTHGGLRIR